MVVNECCKLVAKTIVDKLKSDNRIMVAVLHNYEGDTKEIRVYTPNGKACGSKSLTISEFNDMFQTGITGIVSVDLDKLIRNQGGT